MTPPRPRSLLLPLLLVAALVAPSLATGAPAGSASIEEARSVLLARLRLLQDLRDAGLADPVGATAAQAILLTHWQAVAAGSELPALEDLERHASPSEAAGALAARFGVEPTEEQRERLAALDALPGDRPAALTLALDAFLAFDRANAAAFAVLSPEERAALTPALEAGDGAPLMEKVDLLPVLAARNRLVLAGVALHAAFAEKHAVSPLPTTCAPLVIPPALMMETVGCDSYHDVRVAFAFDAGGWDVHASNNGGSNLCVEGQEQAAGALFDLEGNDAYVTASCGPWGDQNSGVTGGGYSGSGFLFDSGGHDRYEMKRGDLWDGDRASGENGGGNGGTGALLDFSGHDLYTANGGGVNGGGSTGFGMLVDGNGDDDYYVETSGANGGGSLGVGSLLDGSGNDYYDAWGGGSNTVGTNGAGNLGVGFLADLNGIDQWIDWRIWGCRNDYMDMKCTTVRGQVGLVVDDHNHNSASTFSTLSGVAPLAYGVGMSAAQQGTGLVQGYVNLVYNAAVGLANQAVGIALGLVGTVQATADPYLRQVLDADQDGYDLQAEVAGHSDPASAASTPGTDDDRDGVPNSSEASRAHAMGAFATAAVRVASSDHVWVHFGLPGASAAVTTPSGATMRITYVPQTGPNCPGALPKPAASLMHDCFLPVAVRVTMAGQVEVARGAYEPGVNVPLTSIRVVCAPAPGAPLAGPCLVGAAADGTWTLQNGLNYAGAPSGVRATVAGKSFVDTASGQDMASGGSGQDSRSGVPLRVWNWRHQSSSTVQACNAPVVAMCLTGAPEENALNAGFYPGG